MNALMMLATIGGSATQSIMYVVGGIVAVPTTICFFGWVFMHDGEGGGAMCRNIFYIGFAILLLLGFLFGV
jgi:hypothetical protein